MFETNDPEAEKYNKIEYTTKITITKLPESLEVFDTTIFKKGDNTINIDSFPSNLRVFVLNNFSGTIKINEIPDSLEKLEIKNCPNLKGHILSNDIQVLNNE